jgi:muramoyltetrapeptide carboxypeptidase
MVGKGIIPAMHGPLLSPGARVGVFAPSGNFDPDRLELGLDFLRGWGLEPVIAPGLGRRARYLAGSDDLRLADLVWALTEPGLDAAWLARGGYGLTRLLHRIPYRAIPSRPVIGFSDASALFSALWSAGVGRPVHGPVLQSLVDHHDEASREALWRLLFEGTGARWPVSSLVGGEAAGPLIGGNLCTLASLAGTPHALAGRGAIVLLEEVGERPYRVDRLLTQLLRSGALAGVAAVALGQLSDCEEPGQPEWDAAGIATEILAELGVPVVAGAPVGHGAPNHAFPWGARAQVDGELLSWELGDATRSA